MLLCSKHHMLVHEGGFTIEQDYRGRWLFRCPDGRAVPSCGYRAEDMTDEDIGTEREYFHPHVRASAEVCLSVQARPSAEVFPSDQPSAETWMIREPSAEMYRAVRNSVEVRATAG